jgi:hypothetical protein
MPGFLASSERLLVGGIDAQRHTESNDLLEAGD